ncbi:MAG TPA: indole-3-glycerol phosphate synthase TrpC [Bacteroidota bacterium]|nr:indole-3-glycerol phosphate synthase TrpC [Bacteroidota bacterium]
MNILEQILAVKRKEVETAKYTLPLRAIERLIAHRNDFRPFMAALKGPTLRLIAEIKRASPSRGELIRNFDHRKLAREYESFGARALSVLTDREFFKGSLDHLKDVRRETSLPILRKDFIIDEYQLYESVLYGADAVLLIVAALDHASFRTLYRAARELGLSVLVETTKREEIDSANEIDAEIIGVNNRDLTTFNVLLERSLELRSAIRPGAVAVSESGMRSKDDLLKMKEAKYDAVLVGEGLRSPQLRSVVAGEVV